jgi:hypothetical protein
MLITPSATRAAVPTLVGSEKSPRTGVMPAAWSRFAAASLRARPVSSCPAERSRSATALPMYPLAPVRKTLMDCAASGKG